MIMHMKRSSKKSWPLAMSKYIIWFHNIISFETVYNMRLSCRSIPTLFIAQSTKNVGHNEPKLDHGAKILWPSCYGGSHVCPIYLAQQRSTQSFRAQRTIQPNPYGLRCYPNLVPFHQHQKLQLKGTYTWDLSWPAVVETFSRCCIFFRKQRKSLCTSWIIYALSA